MKIDLQKIKFAIQSLLAGSIIGLGCIAYVVNENHIVGSFLFSLGLISVIVQQLKLYTGKIGYFGKYCNVELLPMIVLNFIGIFLTCYLFTYTRLDLSAAQTIVETKAHDSLLSLFILGIGCGSMMFLAVDNYKETKHPLMVVLPIMFFILCGFEHCVADVGYVALAGSEYWNFDMVCRIILIAFGNAVGSLGTNIFNRLICWNILK